MAKRKTNEEREIVEGKIFAVIAYLSIFCIIPLILKKENKFALSHAKQGLVIFVAEVAVFILHIILGQWFLRLGMFVLGVLSFIGIITCLKGEYVRLPLIADIADKITL